jgi:hypothetical protein
MALQGKTHVGKGVSNILGLAGSLHDSAYAQPMNRTTIRDSLKHSPFKHFVIHVADGQTFQIDDPDDVAMSRMQEVAIVFTSNHYHVLDTTKITSIEVLP